MSGRFHNVLRYGLSLASVFGYFAYVAYHYGLSQGLSITALTWSFFVFCTPIADAGFLLDFPLRLFTGLRMVYSEIIVWVLSLGLNGFVLIFSPAVYGKTLLLSFFYKVLTHPFPYWGLILLCGIGTFFSVYFADELVDVVKFKKRDKYHRHLGKYHVVLFACVLVLVVTVYELLFVPSIPL